MLREWLAAGLVLGLLAGGALGWYVRDRDGALSAQSLGCDEAPHDERAPHLLVRVLSPDPLPRGRVLEYEIVAVNPSDEPITVWEMGYESSLHPRRWDGLYEPGITQRTEPLVMEGYNGTRVEPGMEAWIAFVTFEVWSAWPDEAGGREYRIVANASGLCGVAQVRAAA